MTIVRDATSGDEAAVEAVTASAITTLRQTYRPTAAAIARKAQRALTRLVAVSDDQIVGTVEYCLDGGHLHVIGLNVSATHRRQGVARCLVDALVAIAKRVGANRLSLFTIRETGNVPIFERLGFVITSEAIATDFVSDRFERLSEVQMQLPLE
jgi:GNAT superfamily N-acetyltransferase